MSTTVISLNTIELLLNSGNIKTNILESNQDKIKKLIENKLLLNNVNYIIKETDEYIQPLKNSSNTKKNSNTKKQGSNTKKKIKNLINVVYSYDIIDKIMKKIEKIQDNSELIEIISTITNNVLDNKVIIQSEEYSLDESQYYIFDDIVRNLLLQLKEEADLSSFCEDLLKNEYYYLEFLPKEMGINEAQFLKEKSVKGFILSFFFLFSYLIFPTQQIDNQLYLFPKKYRKQLYAKYFEKNSKIWYYTKKILRGILAIPGIIISPIIYLVSLNALQNLS